LGLGRTSRLPLASLPDSHFARQIFLPLQGDCSQAKDETASEAERREKESGENKKSRCSSRSLPYDTKKITLVSIEEFFKLVPTSKGFKTSTSVSSLFKIAVNQNWRQL